MKYQYQDTIVGDLNIINNIVLNIIKDIRNIINNEDLCFDLRLILNELLINSHEHGNQRDCKKCIKLSMLMDDTKIKIEVVDEGKGFVRQTYNPKSTSEHGRGLVIVESLVDKLIIEKNKIKCKILY